MELGPASFSTLFTQVLKTGRDVIINASVIQGYHQSLKTEVNLI